MWLLEWFDPRSGRPIGAAVLGTLDDDAMCAAFEVEPGDPRRLTGTFTVGSPAAAALQRHTEHPIAMDRHDYELRQVSAREAERVLLGFSQVGGSVQGEAP